MLRVPELRVYGFLASGVWGFGLRGCGKFRLEEFGLRPSCSGVRGVEGFQEFIVEELGATLWVGIVDKRIPV